MNLVIDIGNTKVKMAVFEQSILLYHTIIDAEALDSSIRRLLKDYKISHAIISHVAKLDHAIIPRLEDFFDIMLLDHRTPLPFLNRYKTPDTLGVDRMALAAGAVKQFPKQNVLVIDAGSCITYDFVNQDNEYHGGAISPGIQMRYKAVNEFTENLPLLPVQDVIPEQGNSTSNALHLGILNGVIQEIDGVICQYRDNFDKLTVVLTGGDTIFLAKNLKSSIFAIPNFLLEGLNSILIHNIDE